ncbi:hypothetical protein WG901_23235 [Novosphingobium sp. PS1R-30]|uniref:Lipoprotein n=1 Tax=Novosphingobium anseongense TaxID=3133436 RepID=A0ABU8S2L2_9SPHN
MKFGFRGHPQRFAIVAAVGVELMRSIATLFLATLVFGCNREPELPQILRDKGDQAGKVWLVCGPPHGKSLDNAIHNKRIVARLNSQFPPGSPASRLDAELARQGFELHTCQDEPTIRNAKYSWKSYGGGLSLITYKVNSENRIEWVTGVSQNTVE